MARAIKSLPGPLVINKNGVVKYFLSVRQTDMAISIQFVVLIMNIYTLCGLPSLKGTG